jgi:hypothetical protein
MWGEKVEVDDENSHAQVVVEYKDEVEWEVGDHYHNCARN